MKKLFAVGVVGLIVFEIANVYFIMPMPGSQRMRSLDVAYALYEWRWPVRVVCGVLIAVSALPAWRAAGRRKWLIPAAIAVVGIVTYLFNFRLSADQMFREPTTLAMAPAARNKVASDRLVVGIEINGDARAYPLQFIGYHHQVRDTVGGQEVLVSYCTVCRTGRVFTPVVEGQVERFRLVGMDQFNAMFEDETTGSWWRQANGEAVAGSRKGTTLPEIPSVQVTLKRWLSLHPASLVMQGDATFADDYAKDYAYERGTSRKQLTGTDTLSWRDKSWVVGISLNEKSKAYDWNRLRRERSVNDEVGGVPIVLVLASDNESFFAFQRPDAATRFALRGDSLVSTAGAYDLGGHGPTGRLTPLVASQEFWHSWRGFQPGTERY
ncbi:MAG: DUF3179 domain-containing (seleno)protein [Gemmatimonadaceae bacterium]|nr:DUF3179 domain-containing (seleno)protein [Gemmatimonadaceae bacterium]